MSKRQYYYRVSECTAIDATDPSCICWHDEGTGPQTRLDPNLLEWRDARGNADSMGKLIDALQFVIRHSDSLTPSDIQRMQAILAEVTGDKQ